MPVARCRAKDKANCPVHGTPCTREPQTPAEDLFAAAISRNPAFQAMEEKIRWAQQKRDELALTYQQSHQPVGRDYHPIPWEDPALALMNDQYDQLDTQLTDDERAALREYTGILYMPINEYYNNPDAYHARFSTEEAYLKQRDRLETTIQHLDSALAKQPVTIPARPLYRVLGQDQTEQFVSAEQFASSANLIEGETVTFPAYASTSIDPGFINRYVSDREEHSSIVLIMHTSQGAPVSRTAVTNEERVYTQDTEREYLLPRGTRWKVQKVERGRFHSRDDEPLEPVTVHLVDISS